MNYDFFHRMSKREARDYFDHFIWEVREGLETMQNELMRVGLNPDYSMRSIPAIFKWVVDNKINTIQLSPDMSLPEWIRGTEEYKEALFEYDDESKIIVNRMCFYFGECFVRTYRERLKWSIGNARYIQRNMPVVKGFTDDLELAPLIVANNILVDLIIRPGSHDVGKVIKTWEDYVPSM